MKTEIVKVSDLNWGDTVVVEGKTKTVGKYSVTKSDMGALLFGEPFRNGIERVLYRKTFKGEFKVTVKSANGQISYTVLKTEKGAMSFSKKVANEAFYGEVVEITVEAI